MIALADQCLADYDENGWRNSAWLNPGNVAASGRPTRGRNVTKDARRHEGGAKQRDATGKSGMRRHCLFDAQQGG